MEDERKTTTLPRLALSWRKEVKTNDEPRTFAEAIDDLRQGKRVTKLEWDDPEIFLVFHQDRLCIYGSEDDNMLHPLVLSGDVLFGTDFVIVDGPTTIRGVN
jgi:hypothetical protein